MGESSVKGKRLKRVYVALSTKENRNFIWKISILNNRRLKIIAFRENRVGYFRKGRKKKKKKTRDQKAKGEGRGG